jgi:hypothetical protein
MTHIVFNENEVGLMLKVIELDEALAGDVIQIKDDYAVGPVEDLYAADGYQQRRDWWKSLLAFSPYTEQMDLVDDKLTMHNLLKKLEEEPEEQVWIWMAQNAHDVSGYYWVMSQLKEYQSRIHVLYLNNLPFINEKGNIFYPAYLSEIQPTEFLKAKKLARPITLSEFELDPDEWKKTMNENAMVRFLEGGKKIVGKEVDFYDKDILVHVTNAPQKLMKLTGTTLSKMKVKTGDVFLIWRIREMAAAGKLQIGGDWEKGWKEITVSYPGGNATAVTAETEAEA